MPASAVEGENATLFEDVCRTVLRRADSSGSEKSPHEKIRVAVFVGGGLSVFGDQGQVR